MSVRKKPNQWLKNQLATWRTAGQGLLLATRQPAFLASTLLAFFAFGTLMSLLSGGTAGVGLIFHGNFPTALNIIAKAFFGLFGVGRSFTDWLLIFAVSLLQAIVVGLLILIWRRRKSQHKNQHDAQTDHAQRAGIAAGLAVLGTGCPTCGTTLLMPIITAVVGSSSLALAGTISGLLTFAAVAILLHSFKKLGQEAYTTLIVEEFNIKEQPS